MDGVLGEPGRKVGCLCIPYFSKALFWLQESRLLKGLFSWKEQGADAHFAFDVEYWFSVSVQPLKHNSVQYDVKTYIGL